MQRLNLAWLRIETARLVNFNAGQPDEDFDGTEDDAWANIDDALNEAYTNLLNALIVETDPDLFTQAVSLQWPVGQLTLKLPSFLTREALLCIEDITSSNPGELVWITARDAAHTPNVMWLDGETMQWGTEGPPSTKTLRIHFQAFATEMKMSTDEPVHIPARFRRLLVWDAGIILRTMADDAAPQAWVLHRNKLYEQMELMLSQGQPRMTNRARIMMDHLEND